MDIRTSDTVRGAWPGIRDGVGGRWDRSGGGRSGFGGSGVGGSGVGGSGVGARGALAEFIGESSAPRGGEVVGPYPAEQVEHARGPGLG